jgi:hypothetical protein
VPRGLQKACIDRLGRRINLFVRWAVIGLATVGFLGCGFMVYVLFQWMQETVRKD